MVVNPFNARNNMKCISLRKHFDFDSSENFKDVKVILKVSVKEANVLTNIYFFVQYSFVSNLFL